MFSDHKRIKLEVNKNGNRKISKCLNAKQYTSKQSMGQRGSLKVN